MIRARHGPDYHSRLQRSHNPTRSSVIPHTIGICSCGPSHGSDSSFTNFTRFYSPLLPYFLLSGLNPSHAGRTSMRNPVRSGRAQVLLVASVSMHGDRGRLDSMQGIFGPPRIPTNVHDRAYVMSAMSVTLTDHCATGTPFFGLNTTHLALLSLGPESGLRTTQIYNRLDTGEIFHPSEPNPRQPRESRHILPILSSSPARTWLRSLRSVQAQIYSPCATMLFALHAPLKSACGQYMGLSRNRDPVGFGATIVSHSKLVCTSLVRLVISLYGNCFSRFSTPLLH